MANTEGSPLVFVSYSRADRALVDRLIVDLAGQGIAIWIDQQGLRVGTPSWEQALRDAIRTAGAVVMVASPNSRGSRYVADELRIAEMYGCTVYPFWAAGEVWMECVPIGWGSTQHVDGRDASYGRALQELVTTLREAAGAPMPGAPQLETGTPIRNPYKGLRAFTGADSGDFFGREDLIGDLLSAIGDASVEMPRILAVIGPSGSGKSSVVLAGLLPRLRAGALVGSEGWVYLDPLVPGAHPLESLCVVLANALPGSSMRAMREDLDGSPRGLHMLASRLVSRQGSRVVLVVDQSEELFTLTTDEGERRTFIDLLVTAVSEPRGPLQIILTLRADFYDRPLGYPALGRLLESRGKVVLPMSLKNLREAIEGPAALPDVRLRFEDGLVGDLLFEVRGQAGALPLLQFTLDQLFQRRVGGRLTLAAYQEIGGVRGALAGHAEATYAALPSDEHRRLARALFLRLVDPGATEQDTTRRRSALGELLLPSPESTATMHTVADAFVAARLLTTNVIAGVTTIEVSHEALIREWSRLADWLRDARDDIRMQGAISADAAEWQRRGSPPDRVYHGSLLVEALAWAERNTPSAAEQAFLAAGIEERYRQEEGERDQQAQRLALAQQALAANRRAVVRLCYLAGVLVLSLVVATVLTVFAVQNAATATAARTLAQSRELAAQSLNHLGDHYDLALLLSVEANRVANTVEARSSLLQGLEHDQRLIAFLHGDGVGVASVADDPGGKILAAGRQDGSVQFWDLRSGHALGPPITAHVGNVSSLAFSPNGRTMASSGADGTIRLWDVAHRALVGGPLGGGAYHSYNVAFSPDGKILASGSDNDEVLLWDLGRRRLLGKPLANSQPWLPGMVPILAFSPDGKTLASASWTEDVLLWDLANRHAVHLTSGGQAGEVNSLTFSADGKILALAGEDQSIRLWSTVNRRPLGRPIAVPTHGRPVVESGDGLNSLAFSPDSRTLISGSLDGNVQAWDPVRGQALGAPLTIQAGGVTSLTFIAGGWILAAGSDDGDVLLWDMAHDQPLGPPLITHTGGEGGMATSSDGRTLAFAGRNGTIQLWDLANRRPLGPPLASHTAAVTSLAFSANGKRLASGSNNGEVLLWKVGARQPLGRPLLGHTDSVTTLAFSPDGTVLASGSADKTIRLWDVAREQPLGQPLTGHTFSVTDVAFSADGKTLASGSYDGTTQLWQVARRQPLDRPLGHSDTIYSVAFSPDGKTIVSGSNDGSIRRWDLATRESLGPPLGHAGGVTSLCLQ
jgi:WD40 repeat protein